jgi:ferrochelatase
VEALARGGTEAVIVCPIGFVADHIEVVWDLDHELRLQAQEAGIAFARAATPNADLARVAADLLDELRTGREPARIPGAEAPPVQGFSVNGVVCTPRCDSAVASR